MRRKISKDFQKKLKIREIWKERSIVIEVEKDKENPIMRIKAKKRIT